MLAIWCLTGACFCSPSCIMVEPVGGPASIETYSWTGQGMPNRDVGQSLAELAQALTTRPSGEGKLTELGRAIVIPFYEQDKPPVNKDGLPDTSYDLLDPVLLTGSDKGFDFPKRCFISRIMFGPMTGIPMSPPPEPGVIVFAEGCWPAYGSRLHYGPGTAHIEDTRAFKTPKAELVVNVLVYYYENEGAAQPAYVIRAVHYPLARGFDPAVSASAGCSTYDESHGLPIILEKDGERLLRLIDKSRDLSPQDRLMIYQQLIRLLEGMLESERMAKHPEHRDALTKVLQKLRAKLR